MKNILVTGATGLVGAHLIIQLTEKGYQVNAIKRENSDLSPVTKLFDYYNNKNYNSINWINADMLCYQEIEEALDNIEIVYHTAAIVDFKADKNIVTTNTQGTANIVNACLAKSIKKLCFVSSIASLGKVKENETQITELCEWDDTEKNSKYSLSKYKSELEVWRGIEEGLNAIIVNPSIILGPFDWNKSSCKIFKTIYNGLKYFTKGIKGYVDVRDVCNAMILLTESEIINQKYILNSDNISFETLFKLIAKGFNLKEPNKYLTPQMSGLLWKLAFIFGQSSKFNKSMAKSAHSDSLYSSKKIIDALNYKFIDLKSCINNSCKGMLYINKSK